MMAFYKYHDMDSMMDGDYGSYGGHGGHSGHGGSSNFYKMTMTTTSSNSSRGVGGGSGGSRNMVANGTSHSGSHTSSHTTSRTTVISSSSSMSSAMSSSNPTRGVSGGPVPDNVYVEKLQAILGPEFPAVPVPLEPTPLIGVIYLGTSANADNKKLLKSLGIRHLLNCAGTTITDFRRKSKKMTSSSSIKSYEEIYAEDTEDYEIRSHFDQAHRFLDKARNDGGKILIYCPSVNRSGAIAISYLMKLRMPLLQAAQMVKFQRKAVLYNIGFIRQLVAFARDRLMLDADVDMFDGAENNFRMVTSSSYFLA